VRPLEPGYRRIAFRPEVPGAGLDSVSVTYESVRGPVASAWRRTPGGGLELDVTVPPNATGVVSVPAPSASAVSESSGVRPSRTEQGRVVYEVGSGRYRFRVGAR
jgi:alpha-L-rhamnosidase